MLKLIFGFFKKSKELAKAKRGLAKFDELNKLYDTYDKDNTQFMTLISQGYNALLYGEVDKFDTYDADIFKYAGICNKDQEQIKALFDAIKAGDY
jgi:hypothetical protein